MSAEDAGAARPPAPGLLTVCLPCEDVEESVRFYEALGFERDPDATDAAPILVRGSARLGLFGFLDAPLLDLRGADPTQLVAALQAAGFAEDASVTAYAAGEGGATHDGHCAALDDPAGNSLLLDRNAHDTAAPTRAARLRSALRNFDATLEDLGADEALRAAYRSSVLERFAGRDEEAAST